MEKDYRFEGFVVDARRRSVTRNGEPVSLTSKALETLFFLLDHHGKTVTKRQIMDAVWADTAVEENNLTQQISALRKAFGEQPDEHRFIVTVPGTGYAFIAPWDLKEDRSGDVGFLARAFADHGGLGYALATVMVILGALTFVADLKLAHRNQATIAVLAFRSIDQADDPLASGMPYTLTAKLGDLNDVLNVRPASDLLDSRDLVATGRELDVDTVLNGTVQHEGGRVRVSVQMVDISGRRVIWGRNIDADSGEGFSAQDAVADEVVAGLREFYGRS